MADAEDPELSLEIPIRAIYEEFYCPICFDIISECMITPCGHNFCSKCINECLNRKHACPCCNRETVQAQLIKNHTFDKLVELVNQQKEAVSKKYFEKLIVKPNMQALTLSQEVANVNSTNFSPIEKVFHKHMKRSLMDYQEFYQDIHAKFQASTDNIQKETTEQLAKASTKFEKQKRRITRGSSDKTIDQARSRYESKTAKLQKECNDKLAALEQSFNESVQLLIDVYDKYMEGFAPPKQFLPTVVNVRIPEKDILLRNVSVSRTDAVVDLKNIIQRRLAEDGNPIYNWGKTIFSLRSAFSEIDQSGENEEIIITDENRPVIQYGAQPGWEIIVQGCIKLDSDKPKMCFTANYTPGAITDYYSCNTCKFNWICKECAENCHKGHKVVLHNKNHKSTWNCCYCVKHKKCTLINKNTK